MICRYQEDADFVVATNILAVGQIVSACRSNLLKGRKQEPVGNREEVHPLA